MAAGLVVTPCVANAHAITARGYHSVAFAILLRCSEFRIEMRFDKFEFGLVVSFSRGAHLRHGQRDLRLQENSIPWHCYERKLLERPVRIFEFFHGPQKMLYLSAT